MKQNSFTYDQLIDCAKGVLFGKGNAQLPMPPMLMFDRITSINETGGLSVSYTHLTLPTILLV